MKTIEIQDKKLKKLTKNIALPNTHWDTVQNLSTYVLSDDETKILENALTFAIQPPYINKSDVVCPFEHIYLFLSKELEDESNSGILKSQLSHLANTYINSYKPSFVDLKKYKLPKNLKNNKNIVIVKPDKGNGVVILDRKQDVEGIHKIIDDHSKFIKLDKDPTLLRKVSFSQRNPKISPKTE